MQLAVDVEAHRGAVVGGGHVIPATGVRSEIRRLQVGEDAIPVVGALRREGEEEPAKICVPLPDRPALLERAVVLDGGDVPLGRGIVGHLDPGYHTQLALGKQIGEARALRDREDVAIPEVDRLIDGAVVTGGGTRFPDAGRRQLIVGFIGEAGRPRGFVEAIQRYRVRRHVGQLRGHEPDVEVRDARADDAGLGHEPGEGQGGGDGGGDRAGDRIEAGHRRRGVDADLGQIDERPHVAHRVDRLGGERVPAGGVGVGQREVDGPVAVGPQRSDRRLPGRQRVRGMGAGGQPHAGPRGAAPVLRRARNVGIEDWPCQRHEPGVGGQARGLDHVPVAVGALERRRPDG